MIRRLPFAGRALTPIPGHRGGALRIALVYAVAGLTWIMTSDRLLQALISDPAARLLVQSGKGALFVIGSGVLLYVLIRRLLDTLARSDAISRKREETFRALIENISDAVTILKPDGTVSYVSPAFERITGYTAEERVGQSALARVHPDDLESTARKFARLAATPGATVAARPRMRHKNGAWRTIRLLGRNLTSDPAVGGIVVTYSDVTRRVRTEERLRESEAQFRLMVEGSEQVFFYEHDEDGRFLYLSPSVRSVLGYDPADLIGRHYGVLLTGHHSDEDVHRRSADALASGTRSEPYVARTRHRDGRAVALELIERPLVRNGSVIGLQGFARDITKRLAAERSLRQSEERFRSLIENSSDTVTVLDRRGIIRFQTASVRRLLGFEPADLLGRSGLRFVHPEDLPGIARAFRSLSAERGRTETIEFRCRATDHRWRVIAATAHNRLHDPAIGGIVVNARDITDSRAMEEQFRQAQKMEAVGRLAGGVAHDFNNILTAITGHVDIVLADLPEGAPHRVDVAEIGKSAARAADLTRQLLAFSRQQVLRPRVLDLRDIIDDMEGMLRRLISADVLLETDLDPDLCRIEADPGQVQQVIMNLVVNARDAMPHGGRITVATRNVTLSPADVGAFSYDVVPGPYAVLSISDDGEGMDRETLDHIFDPFFTTKAQGKGTGLGLSTVYGIVKQSEGYIWADSEPGVGTTFRVFFPRSEAEPQASPPGPADEPAATARAGTRGTVLVVEDEAPVRELIRRILRREGYHTIEAGSGQEALDRVIAQTNIDLVLTDVVMPGMGGEELSRAIRRSHPGATVLFMSGYTQDEVIRGGVIRSEVPFLQKPFSPRDLLQAVGAVLPSKPPSSL